MNKIPHRYVNKNIDEIQNAVNELISKQGDIIDFINKDCMIIQEMLPDMFSNRTPVVLVDKFNKFIEQELRQSNDRSIEVLNWSMEQLWLAFVMKEKFNFAICEKYYDKRKVKRKRLTNEK